MAKQCWRKNVFDYLANLIYDDQLDLYDYCRMKILQHAANVTTLGTQKHATTITVSLVARAFAPH